GDSERGEAQEAEHREFAQEGPAAEARQAHGSLIDARAVALETSGTIWRAHAEGTADETGHKSTLAITASFAIGSHPPWRRVDLRASLRRAGRVSLRLAPPRGRAPRVCSTHDDAVSPPA